MFLAF